jgi:hypothetical protein
MGLIPERGVEAGHVSGLLGVDRSTYVTVHSHAHAYVPRGDGGHCSQHEGDGGKQAQGVVLAPANEQEDDYGGEHHEHGADGVLGEKEGLRARTKWW